MLATLSSIKVTHSGLEVFAVRPWLVEGELYNGRVAMLAAAGILLTEAVGRGPWWTAPERVRLPVRLPRGSPPSSIIHTPGLLSWASR